MYKREIEAILIKYKRVFINEEIRSEKIVFFDQNRLNY